VLFFNNLSPLAPFHSFFVLIHSYCTLHPYPKVRRGVIFLITYHQSLLSIHSSCCFIPVILTILRLGLVQFFLITYHHPLHSFHHNIQTQCSMSSAMTSLPIRHSFRSDIPTSRITIFARRHIVAHFSALDPTITPALIFP